MSHPIPRVSVSEVPQCQPGESVGAITPISHEIKLS
jgi:hypothetical protein